MALVATVAGATSNSYLTVADADALAVADLGRFAAGWLKATIEDRERALMRATAEIDAFVGYAPPFTSGQALAFPRPVDVDDAGSPVLPSRLKRACYLQAAFLVENADTLDDAATRRARGLSSYSNPDGTGGQIADPASYGRLHPAAEAIVQGIGSEAVIGWIETT